MLSPFYIIRAPPCGAMHVLVEIQSWYWQLIKSKIYHI